jgi:hypothetical protein
MRLSTHEFFGRHAFAAAQVAEADIFTPIGRESMPPGATSRMMK